MFDLIIIGAGVAGMTCALYSLRANKKVLILEHNSIGGQIASSPLVENYPSVKSISGVDLTDKMFEQISEWGCEFEFEDVLSIEKDNNIFKVKTDYNIYEAKSVVIANGCKHRTMGLKNEEALIGKGVSYCAVCDGAFYKGQDVVLIGDANTALQYAMLLSSYCKSVTICTLFDHFFGEKTMIDRVLEKDNIKVIHNMSLLEFKDDENGLTGLKFENTQTKEIVDISTKACFISIGQIPENDRFSNLVDLDHGYIVTDENMETKTKGLYAIGDTRNKKIRQVITAEADGAIASVNACLYLDTLK